MDYEYLDYLVEKKTREEYAIDKFKKRYNYKPLKGQTRGRRMGTIQVDGEEYIVDLDPKNPIASNFAGGKEYFEPRITMAANDTKKITLGRSFFDSIKNQKRRDAILNHEIGHTKFHSTRPKNKMSKEDREKTVKVASKVKGDGEHFNADEVEADLYAAKKSGKKNLKKGLQDLNRPRNVRKSMGRVLNASKALSLLDNGENHVSDKDAKEFVNRLSLKRTKKEKAISNDLKKKGEYSDYLGDKDEKGKPVKTTVRMKDVKKNDRADYNARSRALNDKSLRNLKSVDDAAKSKRSFKESLEFLDTLNEMVN